MNTSIIFPEFDFPVGSPRGEDAPRGTPQHSIHLPIMGILEL